MEQDKRDIRKHPNLNAKRKLLGMDFNAGSVVVLGVVLFVAIGGVGVILKQFVIFLILASLALLGCFVFAKNFLNNRPKSYFTDWLESRRAPNYIPKKFRRNS